MSDGKRFIVLILIHLPFKHWSQFMPIYQDFILFMHLLRVLYIYIPVMTLPQSLNSNVKVTVSVIFVWIWKSHDFAPPITLPKKK